MDHSKIEIDLTPFEKAGDAAVRTQVEVMRKADEAARARLERRKRYVSPPGKYHPDVVPPLLDAKRIEHSIPDIVIEYSQPGGTWCYVYQVEATKKETYGDGLILMTDEGKATERHTTPRGVLISAGARAMDWLWAHGMDIGHTINFLKFQQWRMPVGYIEGACEYILPMRAAHIIGSEEARKERLDGTVTLERCDGKHLIYDDDVPRVRLVDDLEGED